MSETEKPAEAEKPRSPKIAFVDSDKRSRSVDLDWPLMVDGAELKTIVVRRLTVQQVSEFVEGLHGADAKFIHFPMFFRADGERIDNAVLDALDDDDASRLLEVSADFLPRRFRANTGS